jgi:hypothetical protein
MASLIGILWEKPFITTVQSSLQTIQWYFHLQISPFVLILLNGLEESFKIASTKTLQKKKKSIFHSL